MTTAYFKNNDKELSLGSRSINPNQVFAVTDSDEYNHCKDSLGLPLCNEDGSLITVAEDDYLEDLEETPKKSLKWLWILIAAIIVLLLFLLIWAFSGDSEDPKVVKAKESKTVAKVLKKKASKVTLEDLMKKLDKIEKDIQETADFESLTKVRDQIKNDIAKIGRQNTANAKALHKNIDDEASATRDTVRNQGRLTRKKVTEEAGLTRDKVTEEGKLTRKQFHELNLKINSIGRDSADAARVARKLETGKFKVPFLGGTVKEKKNKKRKK